MACRDLEGHKASDVFREWPQTGGDVLSGRAAEAEITIAVSGVDVDFSIKAFPIVGEAGARVVMLRDISALKRAERSLRKLSLELEKKVEERVLALETEIKLRRSAEERLSGLNTELEKTRQEVMFTLSEIIENRGKETAKHVSRVSEYCRIIATASGMSGNEAEQLANASMMHDIGKIAIPDAILQSEDPLDAHAIEILRSHATIGSQILGKSDEPLIIRASRIALEHHERWDGTGYPGGMKGVEISLDARIVGICDVFDSLSTPRAYREEWGIDEILRYFRMERGKSFDPTLVETLFAELHVLLDIAAKYREDDASDANVEAAP
jgi:response regulator RpfG family c-di-GMP phosphodiesterase